MKKSLGEENLLFSDWVDDYERDIVQEGWDSWRDGFYKTNYHKAIAEEKTNPRLYRLTFSTNSLLRHVGDPRKLHELEGFYRMWLKAGYDRVAKALLVRIDEAKYEEPKYEEPEIDIEPQEDYTEEEAPQTQRSLVARVLQFAHVFAKMARG